MQCIEVTNPLAGLVQVFEDGSVYVNGKPYDYQADGISFRGVYENRATGEIRVYLIDAQGDYSFSIDGNNSRREPRLRVNRLRKTMPFTAVEREKPV